MLYINKSKLQISLDYLLWSTQKVKLGAVEVEPVLFLSQRFCHALGCA